MKSYFGLLGLAASLGLAAHTARADETVQFATLMVFATPGHGDSVTNASISPNPTSSTMLSNLQSTYKFSDGKTLVYNGEQNTVDLTTSDLSLSTAVATTFGNFTGTATHESLRSENVTLYIFEFQPETGNLDFEASLNGSINTNSNGNSSKIQWSGATSIVLGTGNTTVTYSVTDTPHQDINLADAPVELLGTVSGVPQQSNNGGNGGNGDGGDGGDGNPPPSAVPLPNSAGISAALMAILGTLGFVNRNKLKTV